MEQVYVLHAAGIIQIAGICVIPGQEFLGCQGVGAGFQKLSALFGGEEIGIADKAFFHGHASADKETASPHFGKAGSQAGDSSAEGGGQFLVQVQGIGLTIDTVTAEKLVSSFT